MSYTNPMQVKSAQTSRQPRLSSSALFILTLLLNTISLAAPPGGPNKKACTDAMTIVLQQDIHFGNFVSTTGGTVTIATDGSRTATGGVVLAGGSPAAGIYEVNSTLAGCEVYPVKIKLPNTTTLTEPIGSTMAVINFISFPATSFILTPGIPQLVEIGADITVLAAQAGGTYVTLASYSITFRY